MDRLLRLVERRRLRRMKSGLSPQNLTDGLRKPSGNLGDKLQVLAGRSPLHLSVVEIFVDMILQRLD